MSPTDALLVVEGRSLHDLLPCAQHHLALRTHNRKRKHIDLFFFTNKAFVDIVGIMSLQGLQKSP